MGGIELQGIAGMGVEVKGQTRREEMRPAAGQKSCGRLAMEESQWQAAISFGFMHRGHKT